MSAPLRIRRPGRGVTKVSQGGAEDFKNYQDRLLKLIPAEAVGLYLIGNGFIPKDHTSLAIILQILWSLVCLAAVIVVKVIGTTDAKVHEPPDWIHVAISSVSFGIWLYTLGGPFALFNLVIPSLGSLLVLAWTFFIPLFYKGPPE